jgi:ATP-dependent DNA helicase RecQ
VGRTRAVEILRGGRSKVIQRHSYDGLPSYGTFSYLTNDEVLGRVDELLRAGALRSTGGRFPKLAAAPVAPRGGQAPVTG